MEHFSLRTLLKPLQLTPLHPQWLAFSQAEKIRHLVARLAQGRVLDIGAGHQHIKHQLPSDCDYISLDYYETAVKWYGVRPIVFGDGHYLPFADAIFDTVLLLDVLEHLPNPEKCIADVHRVLKRGGKLILHVPFAYPLHDTPLDFHRWTAYGLRTLAANHAFRVAEESADGHPLETAALLNNLALGQAILDSWACKRPLMFAVLFLPLVVIITNLRARFLSRLSAPSDFMPIGYRAVWSKE